MTMSMRRAFNFKMMTAFTRYAVAAGFYDSNNDWVEGTTIAESQFGVILSGNRFSQFDEGIALKPTDGGDRLSEYWSLYINDKYVINIEDKIGFRGNFFNIIQQSNEDHFSFNGFLIEKSKDWTP